LNQKVSSNISAWTNDTMVIMLLYRVHVPMMILDLGHFSFQLDKNNIFHAVFTLLTLSNHSLSL